MKIVARLQFSAEWAVYFARENGKDRIAEFIRMLERRRPDLHDRVVASLVRLARHGPPTSPGKFRYEGNGIYALKENQARLYGFFHGDRFIVLTHAAIKKQAKADASILKDALRIKREFERLAAEHIDPFE